MGYYEEKKLEIERLFSLLKSEKRNLEIFAKEERKKINEEILFNKKLEQGVVQMAKERQIGFPWLAEAYDELLSIRENEIIEYLNNKKQPAVKASEQVREALRQKREAIKERRILQYIILFYENIAPFLVDLRKEIEPDIEVKNEFLGDYSEIELEDITTNYLTKEEYRALPSVEKNQLALERFWKRKKSNSLIGKLYERYVGFLYEQKGYRVNYHGIYQGLEDLGRDLICEKDNEAIIIQCKNWSVNSKIYERHIFQFFGTTFQYKNENPSKNVSAVFYTSTQLSDLARKFTNELKITLVENFKLDQNYPCIKCNISSNKDKIYHLPFDQQYDNVKVETKKGEFYCSTVKEAEKAGFRRAFRYNIK